MKILSTIFTLVLLCCAPWCAAQGIAHAVLQANVMVEGKVVTLGDIAKLSGARQEQLDNYGTVQLAIAPQPGYSLHLSQHEVQRLINEAGLSEIALEGANATIVTAVATPFNPEKLVATAKAGLTNSLHRDGLTLEIVQNGTLPAINLPHGEVTLRTRPITAERARSQMVVWIDVMLDGSFYRSVPVSLNVTSVQQVLVARSALLKGQTLSCDNVDVETRDAAALSSAPQDSDCAKLHRRLRRNLSAGDVLLSGELEAIPAISEGESVTLQVTSGAVVLESKAQALTDGQVGQRIAVRAALSQEPVLAMVIAPGIVKVSVQ